jgi:radical SAM-linked protein
MPIAVAASNRHNDGMSGENNPTKQRLLIRFGKFEALKYTSNLDVAKIWERVLRRADLPLLYTQGFNTRPRIQLASALPLGITSECELLDVSLRETVEPDGLIERLLAVSPPGLRIYEIQNLDIGHPALQTLVESAQYSIRFTDSPDLADVTTRINTLLARKSIIKTTERKGKKHVSDLRPLIYDVSLQTTGDVLIHVAVGERGNVRPEDVLIELGLETLPYQVHRQKLFLAAPGR